MFESAVGKKQAVDQVNRAATWVVVVNIGAIFMAMAVYSESFDFWQDAISWLGRTRTHDGTPNMAGFWVFLVGMVATSVILFKISLLVLTAKWTTRPRTISTLYRLAGVGCVIMATPSDLFDTIHQIGATLVFASIWMANNLLLLDVKARGQIGAFLLSHLIMQGTVLPYALLFAIDSTSQNLFQKFAYIGLIASVKLVLFYAKKSDGSS